MPSNYPTTPVDQVGAPRRWHGGSKQKYFLDQPGRNLILALYDGSRGCVEELHRRLGVPRYIVCKWATQMGLKGNTFPRWTEKDTAYLKAHIQSQSASEIAEHLGRTENAVHVKARKLGLSKFDEGYTMTMLCDGLGVHHTTVMRWLKNGWLKDRRRNTDREVGDPYFFTDKDIRDFLRAHPMEVDLRRVDQLWFLDLCLDGLGSLSDVH